jgi:predicted  nucleic acid-binding Zn-ribbon protein
MENIKLLATLQQIDLELDADRRKFAENKEAMAPPASLRKRAAEVKEAEAQVAHWQKERRLRDEEVAAQQAKIEEEETRLYSGRIKDPREQIALQQHVEALKRHLETLEERALEAMLELEQSQERLKKLSQAFEEEKSAWMEKRAALEKEQQAIVEHARSLKARRETVVKHLTAAELNRYETLRAKRGGIAIVALNGRSCGGCGASLPTSVVQQVQAGEIVTCPICGRLLYS